MLSFRAFREVESPVSLDLIVVIAFRGIAGMDLSNARLRELASESGTGIDAVYGRIGALSSGPTDQFVQMLPSLGSGDPSSNRLTAFVWLPGIAGAGRCFRGDARTLGEDIEDPRRDGSLPRVRRLELSANPGLRVTRRLRRRLAPESQPSRQARLGALTTERREVVVASVPELAVR